MKKEIRSLSESGADKSIYKVLLLFQVYNPRTEMIGHYAGFRYYLLADKSSAELIETVENTASGSGTYHVDLAE